MENEEIKALANLFARAGTQELVPVAMGFALAASVMVKSVARATGTLPILAADIEKFLATEPQSEELAEKTARQFLSIALEPLQSAARRRE